MSSFICEKCGYISNSALRCNYWHAMSNKYHIQKGEPIDILYQPDFEYFETHLCCDKCCDGVTYSDNSGTLHPNQFTFTGDDLMHWSDYGKDELIRISEESRGSFVNAKEFFEQDTDKTATEKDNANWQIEKTT